MHQNNIVLLSNRGQSSIRARAWLLSNESNSNAFEVSSVSSSLALLKLTLSLAQIQPYSQVGVDSIQAKLQFPPTQVQGALLQQVRVWPCL